MSMTHSCERKFESLWNIKCWFSLIGNHDRGCASWIPGITKGSSIPFSYCNYRKHIKSPSISKTSGNLVNWHPSIADGILNNHPVLIDLMPEPGSDKGTPCRDGTRSCLQTVLSFFTWLVRSRDISWCLPMFCCKEERVYLYVVNDRHIKGKMLIEILKDAREIQNLGYLMLM